jgi:hypothetical protein
MNRMRHVIKTAVLAFAVLFLVFWNSVSFGAGLFIPSIMVKSGQSVNVPIMIDSIDNLAGVKLVMEYDSGLLTYKKGRRTKETDSMMHVINDKTPGKLIIVMAAARGITGKNFPILTLTFDTKKGISKKQTAKINITDAQLMSENLKDIERTIKNSTVVIMP